MSSRTEPIAIIGLGCRFPGGAASPEAFWELLREGRDGITSVPAERWEFYENGGADIAEAVGRAPRSGGFLADVEGFDSEFFGLSPREAELMDPQQRVLLETTWDALEHAGVPPLDLGGGDTGVFVGIGSDDYGRRMLEDLPRIEAWTGIGAALCAAANRISHAFDLRGPSLAVDTACSSSLVALHLAGQSLASGECSLAIAAGVNLIISPGLTLTLEAAGALAPDGRSKPFDASADGYGRGEGCGVLILKRLADARRDGDRVLAIVRGTAVSQDGHTNGIMAPNAEAQQRVIERACRQADVSPETVDYVEAHGTGTPLGDSLELAALSATYGSARDAGRPCLIGSVKANIGHLEAAAGVAGVIKAVLALGRAEIPPSLVHTKPAPALEGDAAGLKLVTASTPWPPGGRPRRAGVSAFGYGGTIAHVVLEEADEELPAGRDDRETRVFPISAASPAGLREYAGRLADWLDRPEGRIPLASLGHTLGRRRSHLRHRAALVAADIPDLVAGLRLTARDEDAPAVVSAPRPGPVWVFSGHGSQWAGMGRELLATRPAFAAVIDALEPVFRRELGFSPRRALIDGDLGTVDRIQSMIFAVQAGLSAVWRSFGVVPVAVIGHSVGEIAAAVAAGALTLPEGARLICRRSRLLRRVAGDGGMAVVSLSADEVGRRLAGRDDVVVAILASPSSTVISGPAGVVSELTARWRAEGITVRRVATDVAFHSPQMDGLTAELAAAAEDLAPQRPAIPMYSTVLSDPRAAFVADGAYWAANLREPVRLENAVRAAAEDGYRTFVEISAHPVVAHSVTETLTEHGFTGTHVEYSLRRDRPETAALLAAAAGMHCHGVRLDWKRINRGGALATLPGVAWQHRAHWLPPAPGPAARTAGPHHDPDSHTLLSAGVDVAGSALRLWPTRLTTASRPYPGSHTVDGIEIVPAATFIATALAAAPEGGARPGLSGLSLTVPLVVGEPREVQVVREGDAIRVASRPEPSPTALPGADASPGDTWTTHATAGLTRQEIGWPPSAGAPEPGSAVDPRTVRRHLEAVGVPRMAFDWTIATLARGERTLTARVLTGPASSWGPLLDAALSIAAVLFAGPPVLRLVGHVEGVRITADPPESADIEITLDEDHPDTVHARVLTTEGRNVAVLTGIRYAPPARPLREPATLVAEPVWRTVALPALDPAASRRPIVVCGPDPAAARAFAERLTSAGAGHVVTGDVPEVHEPTDVLLLPPLPRPGEHVADAAARSAWMLTSAARRVTGPARLWCLTTGVAESALESHLALSPVWGIGRVAGGERPGNWGGVIDLGPDDPDSRTASTVLRILAAAPREDIFVVRDGSARVPRLVRPKADRPPQPLRCRADGTYLVTGGLGPLGLAVADHLAERGARHIVLAGRREPAGEAIARIGELRRRGVDVRTVRLDVADRERAGRVLSPDRLGLPPVRGLVHAAGVLDNRLLTGVDEVSLRTVMHPKVRGAWVLHELFPPGELDFFVLFSSCGPLLGLPGQTAYAAANAFLDALAAHRLAAGGPETMALGWTSWRGLGMSVNEAVDAELGARGVTAVSAAEAFAAWDLAATLGGGHHLVLGIADDAPRVRLPLLDELRAGRPAGSSPEPEPDGLADLPPEELHAEITSVVSSLVAAEMKLPVRQLDPNRPLSEQGLDSVLTTVIRRRLEKRFGHDLPADLLWRQPTVAAITGHLAGIVAAGHDSGSRE